MDVSIQVKTMVDEDKTIVFRPTGGKSGMRVSSTEIKVKLTLQISSLKIRWKVEKLPF